MKGQISPRGIIYFVIGLVVILMAVPIVKTNINGVWSSLTDLERLPAGLIVFVLFLGMILWALEGRRDEQQVVVYPTR